MKQKLNTPFHRSKSKFFTFKKILYFLMLLIAISIYILQKLNIVLPKLIHNYGNDLLCMPLVLGAITYIIQLLKKDPLFKLPLIFILFMTVFYSFYFEYYLPRFNPRYTADWMDVVLYFTGAMAFFFIERIKKNENHSTKNSA